MATDRKKWQILYSHQTYKYHKISYTSRDLLCNNMWSLMHHMIMYAPYVLTCTITLSLVYKNLRLVFFWAATDTYTFYKSLSGRGYMTLLLRGVNRTHVPCFSNLLIIHHQEYHRIVACPVVQISFSVNPIDIRSVEYSLITLFTWIVALQD